jgi:hypothetical protein
MKKTFKIGEYALGGIIQVEINGSKVTLRCKEWDTKEVLFSETHRTSDTMEIVHTLNDWTSCYYADKVLDYIKKSVDR